MSNKPGRKNFQECLAPQATGRARKRATRRRFIPVRTGIISLRLLSPAGSRTALLAPSLLHPPPQDQVMEVQEAARAVVVEAAEAAVGEIAREIGTCVLETTTGALMRGRFRGWVHPVLRHFMRATCKWLNRQTIK